MTSILKALSSLKLAVILLVLLLLGLSVGTILETRLGTEAAGRLVYFSWWFFGLQGLFALNVALSIADLFPWTRRRVGFLLTHASLILILGGATLTYVFKTEGNLALWEGESSSVIEQYDPQGKLLSSHQLPFVVTLDDFVLDTYPGTHRPSGFTSLVHITDRSTGKSFPARIWMNHPLKHMGFTLFQSSYQQAEGREATVLAVSKDPGQWVAFAGFILLVVGMCVVLATRAVQSGERERLQLASEARKALATLLLACGTLAFAQGPGIETWKRLPVQHDGRVMPLDTLAREMVWSITGSHAWKGEDPVATLTSWTFDPKTGARAPVVKLGSKALARRIGLPGATHASFMQLMENATALQLLQAAREAALQGSPRPGLLGDAEKLEKRINALKEVLFQEAIRPIPDPTDPKVWWKVPPIQTPEMFTHLMSGPRPAAWPPAAKIDQEVFYNGLNTVRISWILLVASLTTCVVAWRTKRRVLDGVAFGLLLAGFGTMSWGIHLRWSAGERIPAANMYESLLFLAWGVGIFAVVGYAFLRNRMVVLNAAFMAALTLLLMDFLPIDRFIHPIAPVLAGTPWLAIHVPIIMLGYAILALGMVVAHMQVGVTVFAPSHTELADQMYDLHYWYVLIGSIFLIAGIITGSMWAAYSWGRYWGWDPKEVWSLVAFLAYMGILHAKVDRMIGKFGVAVLSILAFQTILMTYLGVNFVLTTGMHSYGMGDSPILMWMILVALAEVLFLACGLIIYRRNRSLEA